MASVAEMAEKKYEVEKIIGKRFVRGKAQYRLKWDGFSTKYNSWEPAEYLSCSELLEDFEKRNVIVFCGKFTS